MFHTLKDTLMPFTDYWRFLLGCSIIAIVLAFPRGLVGEAERLAARTPLRRKPEPAEVRP